MTVYGPQTTDKDTTYGWEVLTANPKSARKVEKAKTLMEDAWTQYNWSVEAYEAHIVNFETTEYYLRIAREAERNYQRRREEWDAERAAKLQEAYDAECRCQDLPDGRAVVCQVCRERASHTEILPDQCYGNTK